MTPDKLKHSLRRFRRRTASLHRRTVATIQGRAHRTAGSYPIIRRDAIRGYVRGDTTDRRPTRQELQHLVDWQQSQSDTELS